MAAGTQDELSPGAKATEASLNKYFKGSSDRTIAKVDRVLSQTERILKDDGSKYNFQPSSESKLASRIAGPSAVAFAHPFLGRNMYLTPRFDNASPSFQVEVAIHESAHLQGINAFPPQGETYGDAAVQGLSGSRALNNADSYTQFVMH